MLRTQYKKLTKEQRDRGVIYSSQFIVLNNPSIDNSEICEVKADDPQKDEKIRRLQDVSFFKLMAEEFDWDVINVVRR